MKAKPIEGAHGIGCEIHGLTFDDLDDPQIRQELVGHWVEHGLIVFRGVEGPEFHVKLSRVFGETQAHPGVAATGKPMNEVVRITYDPNDADVWDVDGQVLGGWLPWHMDMVYLDKVNRGAILRPVLLSKEGGRTGFIDKIMIYEKLRPELKEKLKGLSIVYQFDVDYAHGGLKWARPNSVKYLNVSSLKQRLLERRQQFPRVTHPLVFPQRETGRPILNFSPAFAQEIVGLSRSDSDGILEALGRLCLEEENSYFHDWRSDDMVLWDNWRMLHCAGGQPVDSDRVLERTQIMGDYGLGRLASDQEISDEMRIVV